MAVFKNEKKTLMLALQKLAPGDRAAAAELLTQMRASTELGFDEALLLLRAGDAGLREHGVRLLKQQADDKTLDKLIQATKSATEMQRRQMAGTIQQLNLPGTSERLLTYLDNPKDEPAFRFATELLLGGNLSKKTIKRLVEHPDSSVRARLAAKLGEQKNVDVLLEMTADEAERVRNAAVQAVSPQLTMEHVPQIVTRLTQDLELGKVFIPTLIRLATVAPLDQKSSLTESRMAVATHVIPLLSHQDLGLRQIAKDILSKLPDADMLLEACLQHAKLLSGWVRERMIESIKGLGSGYVDPILKRLRTPDPEIRAICLALAVQINDARAIPHLVELLGEPDWWTRIAAIDALGRIKETTAIPALIKLLDDDDVRWQAIEAVVDIGQPAGFQAVVNLLRDPDAAVRSELLKTLQRFKAEGSLADKLLEIVKRFAERDPDTGVREAALASYQAIARALGKPIDPSVEAAMLAQGLGGKEVPRLHSILEDARKKSASDCHLSVNQPILHRIDGALETLSGAPIAAAETKALIAELLKPDQLALLEKHRQLELCLDLGKSGRFRTSIYLDQLGYNAAFRVIPTVVPTFTGIGLPSHLTVLSKMHQGLVVVSGSAGTGKSTTLAAFVNLINDTRQSHVLTMEDPIEVVHVMKRSLINQREIPQHSQSFARALRAALREDPDVIMIGEMRDSETMGLALSASETGHIVFGTLNTTSAPKTVDRIISSFAADEQPQVRAQLSESLKAVICQKLVPKIGGGRLAVFEVLMGTLSLSNLIRDNKTYQIPSLMQVGRASGNIVFDDALMALVEAKQITVEAAIAAAENKQRFELLVPPEPAAAPEAAQGGAA